MWKDAEPIPDEAMTHDYGDGTVLRYWLESDYGYVVEFAMLGDDEEVELSGMVKEDSCMDWGTTTGLLYHSCDPEAVRSLADKMVKIWELAKPLYALRKPRP